MHCFCFNLALIFHHVIKSFKNSIVSNQTLDDKNV